MPIRSPNKIISSFTRSLPAERNRGFGATIAIGMLSLGTFALVLSALGASIAHSDSVNREVARIQKGLDQKACEDSVRLINEKDSFAAPSCLNI